MEKKTLVACIKSNEKDKMTSFARKLLEAAKSIEASPSK